MLAYTIAKLAQCVKQTQHLAKESGACPPGNLEITPFGTEVDLRGGLNRLVVDP